MKRGAIVISIFLFILVSTFTYAIAEQTLETTLQFEAKTNPKTQANILANITFFPRSTEQQQILETIIIPEPDKSTITNNEILILYKNTAIFNTKIINKIKINPSPIQITSADYPLKNLENLNQYLESDEFINPNNENIINLANQLTANLSDEYEIAFEMSNWVYKNINYNLSAISEPAKKDSVWVLNSKQGTCNELSILLTSLLRAKNIPSRIVTGITKTNNSWIPHSWVEAYFPESSKWIPFDPTFAQLGYVDENHIITKYPDKINEPSIKYKWESEKEISIIPKEPIISSSTIETTPIISDIKIKINPVTNQISPLSFLPVRIELENPNNYYVPITLYLKKAPENTKENIKPILLKPNEKKTEFILFPIPEVEDVTTTVEFKDNYNNIYNFHLEISEKYKLIRKAEALYQIEKLKKEYLLNNFDEITLECKPEKNNIQPGEKINIVCTITNNQEEPINNINLCISTQCKRINLKNKATEEISLRLKNPEKEIEIVAEKENKQKFQFLKINLVENPPLVIKSFKCPKIIGINENSTLLLSLEAEKPIKDIYLNIEGIEIIPIRPFEGKNEVIIPVQGNYFANKEGYIFSYLLYKDEDNQYYENYDSCLITVDKYSLKEKINMFIKKLFSSLSVN